MPSYALPNSLFVFPLGRCFDHLVDDEGDEEDGRHERRQRRHESGRPVPIRAAIQVSRVRQIPRHHVDAQME